MKEKMDVHVQTLDGNEDELEGAKVHRTFVTLEGFPRKKLPFASDAEKNFRKAVLEASAELSNDFHTTYLDKVVKGDLGQEILDVRHPATSYETLKKGFLFYLNGSGKYLVLREHLREAVLGLLHQKSLTNHVNGFKTRQQYQSFLHESYSFMLDGLNEALHSTAFDESPGKGIVKCASSQERKEVRKVVRLRDMLVYAQEAFAQGDYENAHRIHTERIARSGDSDDCWIDFALMWLARGDDRLAEIAVREALTKNPENLVALMLAGLIAGRHRDDNGLSYLNTLLKHRPLCPELHVLIATVHSHLGNDSSAEASYDTARSIHTTLTIPKVPKPESPPPQEDEGEDKKSKKSRGSSVSGKEKRKSEAKEKRISDSSQGSSGKKKSTDTAGSEKKKKTSSTGAEVGDTKTTADKKDKKRKSLKAGKGTSVEVGDAGRKSSDQPKDSTPEGDDGKETEKPVENEIKITLKNVGSTKPPTLSSCIFVTWNVTKKRVEKLHPAEFGPDEEFHYQGVYGDATAKEIQEQFNMVLEAEAEKLKANSIDSSNGLINREATLRHRLHPHRHFHRHHKKSRDPHTYATFEGNYYKNPEYRDHEHSVNSVKLTEVMFPEDGQFPERNSTDSQSDELRRLIDEANEPPVYSQRFGSELLWTAHLLLKLRQFEFLDLVLAKEISRGERTLEYLYLRALSLHLRGRNTEALEVIEEALSQNPRHTTFWILKGHAQYNLHDNDEALASYERAMMLPHGKESLHLAYLRFGKLCIDKGDAQLAKRVFLKQVAVRPSPHLWLSIGNACFELGELDDALHAFSEANKLDNTNPIIWAHLSLISLAQGNRNLAEQSYKWAIRFGLKKGKLMDDIKELQKKLGFGSPAFPKLPHCIPHEVFVQRIGRETPMELYAESLNFSHLKNQRNKFENRESEEQLIEQLKQKDADRLAALEDGVEALMKPVASHSRKNLASKQQSNTDGKMSKASVLTAKSKRGLAGKKKGKKMSKGKLRKDENDNDFNFDFDTQI